MHADNNQARAQRRAAGTRVTCDVSHMAVSQIPLHQPRHLSLVWHLVGATRQRPTRCYASCFLFVNPWSVPFTAVDTAPSPPSYGPHRAPRHLLRCCSAKLEAVCLNGGSQRELSITKLHQRFVLPLAASTQDLSGGVLARDIAPAANHHKAHRSVAFAALTHSSTA
jgi:hypothetical protein